MENVNIIFDDFDDAEKHVIGALLEDVRPDFYDILSPEMFTEKLLGNLFGAMKDFWKNGGKPDIPFADDWLKKRGIDANTFLKETVSSSPGGFLAETDMKIIRDRYNEKQVKKILESLDIKKDVYSETDRLIFELKEVAGMDDKSRSIDSIQNDFFDSLFEDNYGIMTGFKHIDDATCGFEGGDLITIGAGTGCGKSSFALQIASFMASQNKRVIYYNLEMGQKQIYQRYMAFHSALPLNKVRCARKLSEEDKKKLFVGKENIEKLKDNLFITNGVRTVSEIRRSVKRKEPDIIFVDYLQLLKSEVKSQARYVEVGQISHELKAIAMEFNIPVVVLVQINRESAKRENKEPYMSEIRESGDIEQDSSIIIMLWNSDDIDKRKKGVKIEKNRQGECGKYQFVFNGAFMRFEDREFNDADNESGIPF